MGYLSGWKYRKDFTIPSSKVDSNETDVQVELFLDSSNFDFTKAESDGSDIRFTASDGTTLLTFERVFHDDSGEIAQYFILFPSLSSSSDNIFYIYYGNTSASDVSDENSVWTSEYRAVYHMDDLTTSTFEDSTSNGNTATKFASNDPLEVDGDFGKGQRFDGNSSTANVASDTSVNISGSHTWHIWFTWDGTSTNLDNLISKWRNPFDLKIQLDDGSNNFRMAWSGNFQGTGFANSAFNDGNLHLIDVAYDGSNTRIYVDNVLKETISGGPGSGAGFDIGTENNNTKYLEGDIYEIRLSTGITSDARRKIDYESGARTLLTEGSEEIVPITINETILINEISDSQSPIKRINETININDTVQSNIDAKFATKIISTNPLIFVTNTDPVEIAKVDVSTPETPIIEIKVLTGVTGAQDISYNSNTGFLYVACEDGKVVKVELNDLTNQTTIDLSDTDDLLTIESLSSFGLTYAGTDNDTGELYLIDERDTAIMNINAEFIAPQFFTLDSSFNLIEVAKMDCNFNLLSEETATMTCDFKLISNPVNEIEPIGLQDFHVFIDNVELENTDLVLESISITHTIDEESEATFQLTRKHDDLNTTLSGNTITITNQNVVRIEIDGNIEFDGNISRIEPVYDTSDHILITALDTEKTNKYHKTNLSLPDLDAPLSLYNILISNPNIFNPVIDATNEDNPKKFKGIRASLGERREQRVVRRLFFDEFGSIAEDIQNGDFNPLQNHSYFWSPTVRLITGNRTETEEVEGTTFTDDFGNQFTIGQVSLELFKFNPLQFGQISQINFDYIGTSLSPVSSDLWDLIQAKHRRQRIFEDEVRKLGDGSVTASDFNEVSNDPTNAFNQLVSRGYLTAGGNITQKFKETETFEDLESSVQIPGNEIGAVYQVVEDHLGYTVGEAPFRDISTRNGVFIPKFKYVDEPNGLYSIKDASYNFTDYVKQVADLEYQKLLNINGSILPETSASLQITVDGYYFYDLSLATKVNIDNTTKANEFKNNNGFPLSIKSITITSADRKVNIQADNFKSTKELEAIDGLFPDETSDEFNEKEQRNLIALKTDMRTRLEVE